MQIPCEASFANRVKSRKRVLCSKRDYDMADSFLLVFT
uniref:Uncharacterized protein n=1 Tax=Anguilla anguilla TaxID=7936 RepID=A0A0E9SXK1_ANGAN